MTVPKSCCFNKGQPKETRVSPSRAPVFFLCPLLPSACYAGYQRRTAWPFVISGILMSVCFLLVGENPGNEVEKTADILWRRDWFPRKGVGLFWSDYNKILKIDLPPTMALGRSPKLTKTWVRDKVFIFYKQNTLGILVLCIILEKLKVSHILF